MANVRCSNYGTNSFEEVTKKGDMLKARPLFVSLFYSLDIRGVPDLGL